MELNDAIRKWLQMQPRGGGRFRHAKAELAERGAIGRFKDGKR